MRTEEEIREKIASIKKMYSHVLDTGSLATVDINAPRALMQIQGKVVLQILHWVLNEEYNHKFPKEGYNT